MAYYPLIVGLGCGISHSSGYLLLLLPHEQVSATLLASGASLKEVEFGDYKDVEQSVDFVLFQD